MMQLILVRHGETEWNFKKTLQGQADIPLSDRGREQARTIAGLVQSLAPERVVASDLARTQETSALLGFPEPELMPAWREADLGDWTGMTVSDIVSRTSSAYQAWRDGLLDPPGAEGWHRFRSRIDEAIRALPKVPGKTLVVTHGGVIRAALSILIGLEPERIVPVNNGSVTIIELTPRPRLCAYNLGGQNGIETSE